MGLWSAPLNLNLAFDEAPIRGSITFISQSGTLGNYLMLLARGKGYGFNGFISSGNQAMLEVSDYLEYFGGDEGSRAIILYIEGLSGCRPILPDSQGSGQEKAHRRLQGRAF